MIAIEEKYNFEAYLSSFCHNTLMLFSVYLVL